MLRYHFFNSDNIDTMLTKHSDIDINFSNQVSKYKNINFYAEINVNHSALMSTFYLYVLVYVRPFQCLKLPFNGKYRYLQNIMHAKSLDTVLPILSGLIDLTPVVTKLFITGITV